MFENGMHLMKMVLSSTCQEHYLPTPYTLYIIQYTVYNIHI